MCYKFNISDPDPVNLNPDPKLFSKILTFIIRAGSAEFSPNIYLDLFVKKFNKKAFLKSQSLKIFRKCEPSLIPGGGKVEANGTQK